MDRLFKRTKNETFYQLGIISGGEYNRTSKHITNEQHRRELQKERKFLEKDRRLDERPMKIKERKLNMKLKQLNVEKGKKTRLLRSKLSDDPKGNYDSIIREMYLIEQQISKTEKVKLLNDRSHNETELFYDMQQSKSEKLERVARIKQYLPAFDSESIENEERMNTTVDTFTSMLADKTEEYESELDEEYSSIGTETESFDKFKNDVILSCGGKIPTLAPKKPIDDSEIQVDDIDLDLDLLKRLSLLKSPSS
jgi:hypothetical protein